MCFEIYRHNFEKLWRPSEHRHKVRDILSHRIRLKLQHAWHTYVKTVRATIVFNPLHCYCLLSPDSCACLCDYYAVDWMRSITSAIVCDVETVYWLTFPFQNVIHTNNNTHARHTRTHRENHKRVELLSSEFHINIWRNLTKMLRIIPFSGFAIVRHTHRVQKHFLWPKTSAIEKSYVVVSVYYIQ